MEKGFTLIIPLYNKIKCVRKTLDTVLYNHGNYPFKCIIIDDDSTDGSSEIAAEYDINHPDIFQYIKIKHHGNKTPVYARNLGIRLTETEYIGFLDADDELCAGFIDRGCTFLDEHPEYSLYGNGCKFHYINEQGEPYYEYHGYDSFDYITNFIDYLIAYGGNVHFSANIYRTKLVRNNLFTDVYGEDVVFKFKYIYKNQPIYVDNSTYETMICNVEYSDSQEWNKQRTDKPYVLEILETVKSEIPEFGYHFYYNDMGQLSIQSNY